MWIRAQSGFPYLLVQVSLYQRNHVGSLWFSCSHLAIRLGIGMIYHLHSFPKKKKVCLSQPSGSYPVASPSSSAQLGQFVKLEKDLASFVAFSLECYCWSSQLSFAYHQVGPEEEEDAVNVTSSKVCCNSSYLEGVGGGICLFFVDME